MEKKLIPQVIIPLFVTGLLVLLLLIGDPFRRNGASIFWASVETFLIFILPMLPIIYGYITRDKVASTLMGAMPFSGFFIVTLFKATHSPIFMRWLTSAIPFWLVLIIIAGLEGYFASQRKIFSFLVAICLYILYILLFLFGIK